ncbi:hypothetical protein M9458_037089, partial [Cirrhinus mrigala]
VVTGRSPALVCCRLSCALGLHSSGFASSLRVCDTPPSLWLPFSSTFVLCCSSSTTACRIHAST